MLDVALIGTGEPDAPGRDGFAMAYRHARAYARLDECRLTACADIVPENARRFADEFGVPDEHVFEDYEAMLAAVEPDVVSVCVPPGVHADIVVGCAESGHVRAVHCEKPMADTWGDCRRMAEVCEREGVQLTINHQLRFGRPFRRAKELLDAGAVGDLRRVEWSREHLFDAGTHAFDLSNYYVDAPVEWVLGNVDYREENRWFGAHNENQAVVQWRYENGVYGLAATGVGREFVGCYLRLVGSEGVLELHDDADLPTLRMRTDGGDWRAVDVGGAGVYRPQTGRLGVARKALAARLPERLPGRESLRRLLVEPRYLDLAVEDVVDSLREDREPELHAGGALAAEELIFAAWESSRRRGRIDLPLDIEDNPLAAMVEAGDLLVTPEP
ncbi:Gfo/Idh/MocA family protein [Halomarina litorea]|uniref:Gfo/Idh/MocA family protein n=1 Tax=Halomarina litorea TaxID=2961595 RepID=UPI0020C32B36|nr:Gfo/Idh/MocA family oxidoreductase [Halomarina sp. BCD28]